MLWTVCVCRCVSATNVMKPCCSRSILRKRLNRRRMSRTVTVAPHRGHVTVHCRPCGLCVCRAVPNAVAAPCGSPPLPRREACCRHCPSCACDVSVARWSPKRTKSLPLPALQRATPKKQAPRRNWVAKKPKKHTKKKKRKEKSVNAAILIVALYPFPFQIFLFWMLLLWHD